MHAMYELKDMLCKELDEYGEKGELTAGSLEIVDKLAHTIKNLETIIAMEEGSSGRYDDSGRYDESGRRSSYARGRGRYARRDSMGRYASRGSYNNGSYNSYDDGMVDDLRELMDGVTDERKRQEFQKFINKVEQM